MAYTKTTWQTGDVVTSEKLNKIENGITNSEQILWVPVHIDESTGAPHMDMTSSEVLDAVQNGKLPLMKIWPNNVLHVLMLAGLDEEGVIFTGLNESLAFNADGSVYTSMILENE